MHAAIGLLFSMAALLGRGADDRCEKIATQAGANIHVAVAERVSESGDLPAFCRVAGAIEPGIGFEARFPLRSWNGKYFQAGCGGFCGAVLADKEGWSNSVNPALRRGYAVLTTDGGHQAPHIGTAAWALNNEQAERLYADESIALAYAAGHHLIERIYRKKPRYSYFSGCSNGGRMAAIAAQRYPALFNGIVSGCPVLNLSYAGGVFGAWVLQANMGEDGARIIGPEFASKVPLLARAAREQCDGLDGVEDGVVAAPFACRMDMSQIPLCAHESSPDCLTRAEAAVVEKWWRGPQNSRGEQLFGGMPAGSERLWPIWYLGSPEAPHVGELLADGYLKFLGFEVDDPGRSAAEFDFDSDVSLLQARGKLFNATDPDISAFRDAGGKMIMWHGLADPLVIPD